jgi:hypothetical protein
MTEAKMTKEDALKLLQAGPVDTWNSFRESHKDWVPDLSGMDLSTTDLVPLSGIFNLADANLCGAKLPSLGRMWARVNIEGATFDTDTIRDWDLAKRGARFVSTPKQDRAALFVFFVEAGQPRTAYLELAELFKDVTGEIRICDPYYGKGSLLHLDLLKHCSPIKFLTKNPDRNEVHLLPRLLHDFKRQHRATEFRENAGTDLHDRYILSGTELILMGHGLKDVGNKDSFVVRIPSSLAPDIVVSVRSSFDQKWANGKPIA